jgi:hypothetical protein
MPGLLDEDRLWHRQNDSRWPDFRGAAALHWKSCARRPVDGRPLRPRIHRQTLVLCGREDVLPPVELHEELAAGSPTPVSSLSTNAAICLSALEQPQQRAEAMQACLSAVRT